MEKNMLHRPRVSKKEASRIPRKWIPQIEIKRKGSRGAATIPTICSAVSSHMCRGLQGATQPQGPPPRGPKHLKQPLVYLGLNVLTHCNPLVHLRRREKSVSPPLPPLRKSFPILLYNESIFYSFWPSPKHETGTSSQRLKAFNKNPNFLLFEARRWLMK